MKIKEIDYGIAFMVYNNGKRYVEVNKHLKKYPKLYKQVLKHEKQHYNSPNKHLDFWIDFKHGFNPKFNWEMLKFSFKHPRAFMSLSLVFFEKRGIAPNWFMVLNYFVLIILILSGFTILYF